MTWWGLAVVSRSDATTDLDAASSSDMNVSTHNDGLEIFQMYCATAKDLKMTN